MICEKKGRKDVKTNLIKGSIMKALFLFILLSVLVPAQIKYWETGSGFFISDSLYQDYPGISTSDSTNAYDVINLGFEFEWLNITAIDTGTTYTDSCIVEYPMYVYELDKTKRYTTYKIVDSLTIWQPVQFMRDSSWTNTNLIPDNASVKSYKIFVKDYDKIRIRMTNEALIAGRVWQYKLSAVSK